MTTDVYNFRGFSQYNFHQTQVPDNRFTAYTEWTASQVQSFFEQRNSFLKRFYFWGNNGDRGFLDSNGNGSYNTGEPKYCSDGTQNCATSGPKTSAAQAIVDAAIKNGQRVNPKLLLVQAQKEHQLVSYPFDQNNPTLPSAVTLNNSFECVSDNVPGPNRFGQQINCAAERLRYWFDYSNTFPFFFPKMATEGQSINLYVNATLGRQRLGFRMENRATYSLYKYTNYITWDAAGGGNYLFEQLWLQYVQQNGF